MLGHALYMRSIHGSKTKNDRFDSLTLPQLMAGSKQGNPYLKWAFSELTVHAAREDDKIDRELQRLLSEHAKGPAKSYLAHRFGRAVYYMLTKGNLFDRDKFLRRG